MLPSRYPQQGAVLPLVLLLTMLLAYMASMISTIMSDRSHCRLGAALREYAPLLSTLHSIVQEATDLQPMDTQQHGMRVAIKRIRRIHCVDAMHDAQLISITIQQHSLILEAVWSQASQHIGVDQCNNAHNYTFGVQSLRYIDE